MIVVDDVTPRWIRELHRFIAVKSLLFLHGNILDRVSYPVRDGEGPVTWIEGDDLRHFLQTWLTDLGYELVGLGDPLLDLRFATPAMEPRYQQLLAVVPPPATPTPAPAAARGNRGPSLRTALGDIGRVMRNTQTPSAFVIDFASRLVAAPDRLLGEELELCTRLLRAALDGAEVIRRTGRWNNVLILLCDKLNDLPPFLYVNNPRARSIRVDQPDGQDRARVFRKIHRAFHQAGPEPPSPDRVAQFSALTEGFSYYEIMNLVGLSRREGIPVEPVEPLIERYKYGITQNEWDRLDPQRLAGAEAFIKANIIGQDRAVARVLDLIKRACLGLAAGTGPRHQRPRGVLFFAGPTGVGKTELAKTLATLLFGSKDRLIRFDMSEYAAEHADQRLLGSPPGYVGFEEGGQLTNAVKEHPFSVLLFDEIEKAHPRIFDKFLQILDDGRLTDGRGETVYFSECILIFTSNLGTATPGQDGDGDGDGASAALGDAGIPGYAQLRAGVLQAIRDHFNRELGRPEILNRFGDSFVVFDFIRPPVDEQIIDLLLGQLREALCRERAIGLTWSDGVHAALVERARAGYLRHGGRGIRNLLDTVLVDPLARWLFDHGIKNHAELRVEGLSDHGESAPYRYELAIHQISSPSVGEGRGGGREPLPKPIAERTTGEFAHGR
jgi:energy-coupling factor transporter ATP-binding protein EcfA2